MFDVDIILPPVKLVTLDSEPIVSVVMQKLRM